MCLRCMDQMLKMQIPQNFQSPTHEHLWEWDPGIIILISSIDAFDPGALKTLLCETLT